MSLSKPRFFLVLALLLSLPFVVSAAPASVPQLVLVFADDPAQVTAADSSGKNVVVAEGMAFAQGTTVRTRDTTVELRLEPNGSVLKLARNTTFRVRALQQLKGASSNDFSVLTGKIRLIAAKVAGVANAYNVLTPTAQAGVRGTDFAVEANAEEGDWVCVKEGKVEFTLVSGSKKGASILVGAGEFANAKNPKFAPKKATAADLVDKFEGLDLHTVKETDVPGHAAS
jgi:hypothetical protein